MSRYINMDFRMTEALLLFWFAPVIAVVILKCGISFIKNIYANNLFSVLGHLGLMKVYYEHRYSFSCCS